MFTGEQADGIDLINGKYSEQLATLKGISREKRQQAIEEAKIAMENADADAQTISYLNGIIEDVG